MLYSRAEGARELRGDAGIGAEFPPRAQVD